MANKQKGTILGRHLALEEIPLSPHSAAKSTGVRANQLVCSNGQPSPELQLILVRCRDMATTYSSLLSILPAVCSSGKVRALDMGLPVARGGRQPTLSPILAREAGDSRWAF